MDGAKAREAEGKKKETKGTKGTGVESPKEVEADERKRKRERVSRGSQLQGRDGERGTEIAEEAAVI